jgi:kynurenine 3-monooxygenase
MSRKIHVIGAGLVGPLMSIYLAKKGFDVTLYERRADMRKNAVERGRSINLAITARGWKALEDIGLKDKVSAISIPMKGRMIHDLEGKTNLQPYGQTDAEVIYSASRSLLNIMLMDAAEQHKNLKIVFDRRCTHYDIDKSTLTLADDAGKEEKVKADTVIAADGAWSAVRKSMQESLSDFTCTQDVLDYGYKELVIPAGDAGAFRIEKNALHIWPRKNFMMIALPNTEGDFTATLFYPGDALKILTTESAVMALFEREFPDAVPQMPELARDFLANPVGSLVTIKCDTWNAGGKAVLIGDAAHAIVPFFAQGMNSGFEDCAVLDSLITGDNPDWEKVFTEFGRLRKPNTDAIADMAVENFVEMRDSVNDPQFILRKKVGFELEKRWPDKFIPRYSMVIFHPEIPYAEAKRRGALQDILLGKLCDGVTDPAQINWDEAEKLLTRLHNADPFT